jgi:UDP-N-acetylmuramate--alanine ligase
MNNFKILENKKIFFCGIGGIGMSAIAGILFESNTKGLKITGSNDMENKNTIRLAKLGIDVFIGHSQANITADVDYFVYTDVVSSDHVECREAQKLNLQVFSRGDFLALISANFSRNINISGTHGKTTTTGMTGQMFDFAAKKPYIVCGGLMKNYGNNYKSGDSDVFIKEADESSDSFLNLKTDTAIVTSIEEDHLEKHHSIENIYTKFLTFCENANNIVICSHYYYCNEIYNKFKEKKNIISYGLHQNADLFAKHIVYYKKFIKFDVYYNDKIFLKAVKIYMFGDHNILNSLASIACGILYKLDNQTIKISLSNFKGISNRFDILGVKKTNLIVNDYAHNPTKIASAISSAIHLREHNEKYKDYKIVIFFEPHKHSRVRTLMSDFAKSFKGIDKLYILDIYKSYEHYPDVVCKKYFGDKISNDSGVEICLVETVLSNIKKEISQLKNSIIVFLSAGNYNLANEI